MYFRWDDCVPHLVKKNVQSFRTNCCRSESSQRGGERWPTFSQAGQQHVYFRIWAASSAARIPSGINRPIKNTKKTKFLGVSIVSPL
jgi:hypothetical protein